MDTTREITKSPGSSDETTDPVGAGAERPSTKGRTVVAARAVVAIARQAATEIEGVELVSRSGLGRLWSDLWPVGGPTDASAEVGVGVTAVELHLSVSWPRPVAEVAAAARRHVQARVSELTGYRVTEVDIVVDALPPAERVRSARVV